MNIKKIKYICITLLILLVIFFGVQFASKYKILIEGIFPTNKINATSINNQPYKNNSSITSSTTENDPLLQNDKESNPKDNDKQIQPQSTPKPQVQNSIPKVLDKKINSIAKSAVQLGDYGEIIAILASKLSVSEMKYIFDSARDDYWETTSVEDIEKARKILFSKLSEADLEKLDQLGRKYGRSMRIIEKGIDVAKIKERQMRKKGLIK